ncbi:hypothetical protein LCGC14_1079370 [marine sediment metagenome]|uniref:Plasmid replication initiator RepA n=1 Tax=marine sediment metagenome TaxID=412755 RepID=A0A0F9PYU4_9ZZZZ
MVTENTNPKARLLPDRHPQHDLFICDVAGANLKDVMAQMEHPFYSLSKKPETNIRRYEHNGNWLQITPSVKGLATIYDKDILIYCISQIMHRLKDGEDVSRRVRINSRELLIFTNRGTSGRDYMALQESLERIRGTTISTNIRTGSEEQIDTFGLIEASSIRRKHGLDGRLLWCEITLSEWVFNAIRAQEVLTLHRDYFRLRKPLERRVYELARKHCGQQDQWRISLSLLLKKSGSQSPEKRFRQMMRELVQHDHLPDYHVSFEDGTDMVIFQNRGTMAPALVDRWEGALDAEVYHDARQLAPGWDVRHIEAQWREWLAHEEIDPRHPERHFLKFCRSWQAKRGSP